MFEESLLASHDKKRSKWRLIGLPVAIFLHLMVLAGVLFAQYWQIEPVQEPPIQVSFYQSAPPPPPPPPPPPAPAASEPEPEPVVEEVQPEVPDEPVQPVDIPEEVPEPVEEPSGSSSDVGQVGGVEGGVVGGVAGGVVGGVLGGVPGGTGTGILRIGGDIKRPVKISGERPTYTEVARRMRIQGIVILEAIIDRSGRVTGVRVLRGLPGGLSEAAKEAVSEWRYKPATLHGKPVSVYLTVTVNYRLN